jgi:hypothetical protein
LEWTKRVTCDVYFFPADWRIEDGDPPSVSFLIITSIMLFTNGAQYPLGGDLEDFTNLNTQLSDVWCSIVHDVAEQIGTQVDPLPLSVDWSRLRLKLVAGLRHTGYDRYLRWFGSAEYSKEEKKKRPAA